MHQCVTDWDDIRGSFVLQQYDKSMAPPLWFYMSFLIFLDETRVIQGHNGDGQIKTKSCVIHEDDKYIYIYLFNVQFYNIKQLITLK